MFVSIELILHSILITFSSILPFGLLFDILQLKGNQPLSKISISLLCKEMVKVFILLLLNSQSLSLSAIILC
jgi:hypothetical protein